MAFFLEIYNGTSWQQLLQNNLTTLNVSNVLPVGSGLLNINGAYFNGQNQNVIIGTSFVTNTTGNANTALGNNALSSNTLGIGNVAIGQAALQANTIGNANTALGWQALQSSVSAVDNTAVGYGVLQANTTGYQNSGLGAECLFFNTTGYQNSGLGYQALFQNITGIQNAAFGCQALYSNSGSENSAFGYQALYTNSSGFGNSAFGSAALYYNNSGGNNSAFGYSAVQANTTGLSNSGFGAGSLQNNTTGSNNSAFGSASMLTNITGSYNLCLGYASDVADSAAKGTTAIGAFAAARKGTMQLGGENISEGVYYPNIFIGNPSDLNAALLIGNVYSNNKLSKNAAIWLSDSITPLYGSSSGVAIYSYGGTLYCTGNFSVITNTIISNNYSSQTSNNYITIGAASNGGNAQYVTMPCQLKVTGSSPYGSNISYGYLNPSGNVGTSGGNPSYSIIASNRIVCSEFNAYSSRNIKNIEATGKDIVDEAEEIFMKIPFSKYTYKDKVAHGYSTTYGLIAEDLAKICPEYVIESKQYVPNVLKYAELSNAKDGLYKLTFLDKVDKLGIPKDHLFNEIQVFNEKDEKIELLVNKVLDNTVLVKLKNIKCKSKVTNKVFVYGSYEDCPTVAKERVFEMGMVVLQSLLSKFKSIENIIKN